MIIDEKGKLFGKINLLDLFLILIILMVLAGAAVFFIGGGGLTGPGTIPLTYTVEIKQKDAEYFSHVIEGEQVIDGVTKEHVGEIVSLSLEPATHTAQADDKLLTATIDGKFDGFVTIKGDATVRYPDLLLGESISIKIGNDMALRSESVAMHGYVVDMDYDESRLKEMK